MAGVRHADELRAAPVVAPGAEGERTVVEPRSRPEAVPFVVEADQGQQHDMQPACVDPFAAVGFRDPEGAAASGGGCGREGHATETRGGDARQVDAALRIDRAGQEICDADLAAHREVAGDARAWGERSGAAQMNDEVAGDGPLGTAAFLGREGRACRARFTP